MKLFTSINPRFFPALQMEIHLAVSGGKFGTDGALSSHRVLAPEIEMEMAHRFCQMKVGAAALLFPRVHAFGFQALEIVLVSAEQRRQVERVRFANIGKVVQGIEMRLLDQAQDRVVPFHMAGLAVDLLPVFVCNGLVGSGVVLFGEQFPEPSHQARLASGGVEKGPDDLLIDRLITFHLVLMEKVCLRGSVVPNHTLRGHASDRKPVSVAAFDLSCHLSHHPGFARLSRCPDCEEMPALALAADEFAYARLDKSLSLCCEMVSFVDGAIGVEPPHGVSPFFECYCSIRLTTTGMQVAEILPPKQTSTSAPFSLGRSWMVPS